MIDGMKRKWGQILSGIQLWLSNLGQADILISLFTFDTKAYNIISYKTPEELNNILKGGLEINGSRMVSLTTSFDTVIEIIGKENSSSKVDKDWLHYEILMTVENPQYTSDSLNNFIDFKKSSGITFFFNTIAQVERVFEITKIATALDGVHYSIKRGVNFSSAFNEALERDPFKEA